MMTSVDNQGNSNIGGIIGGSSKAIRALPIPGLMGKSMSQRDMTPKTNINRSNVYGASQKNLAGAARPQSATTRRRDRLQISENNAEAARNKEIVLIGDAFGCLPILMKTIREQIVLLASKQNKDTGSLAQMNLFVGYRASKLKINLQQTKGTLRTFKQKQNKWITFPCSELIIDRGSGTVNIQADYLDDDGQKLVIAQGQLLEIRILTAQKKMKKCSSQFESSISMGSKRINRFASQEQLTQSRQLSREGSLGACVEYDIEELTSLEQIEHWLRTNDSSSNRNRPIDYSLPFALRTSSERDYVFFARSEEERAIWVHELSNLIEEDVEIGDEINSMRAGVMDMIDPFEAFNVWNISCACEPNYQGHKESAMIQKAYGGDNVVFLRDNQQCYISPTLRSEPGIIDGDLHKELGSKIKRALSGTRKRFIVLDFKKQLVRFKSSRDDDRYSDDKQIPFGQLLDAKVITHDDHKTVTEFHFKMLVQAMSRQYILLARSFEERRIWVDGFCKAIREAKLAEKEAKRVKNMALTSQGSLENLGTGRFLFHSDNLDVTLSAIQGNILKHIDKQQFWHRNDFHQRFFKLEFASPFCFFYEEKWEKKWHKSHKQADIRSCTLLTEDDVQEKLDERKRSKSKSLLRAMNVVTQAKWNFGFQLEFTGERSYELYSPTRHERDKWVEVLAAIAEMNLKSISLESMTPLEYLVEKEAPVEVEESKANNVSIGQISRHVGELLDSTNIAINENQEQMSEEPMVVTVHRENSDETIYRKVHSFLSENEGMMATFQLDPQPSYTSNNMILSYQCVAGSCVLRTPTPSPDASFSSSLMLKPIQLNLSLVDQTLTITHLDSQESGIYDLLEIEEVMSDDWNGHIVASTSYFGFRLVINEIEFNVATTNAEDRLSWLRVLQLILQMRSLDLDCALVNPFVFEHFRQEQLSQYTAILPVEQKSIHRSQESTVTENPVEAFTAAIVPEKTFFTPTMSFQPDRCIEGYLIKAIETKRMLQMSKQHLRYFRVIFHSGKMSVKEDREDSQMRSFQLQNLQRVTITKTKATIVRDLDIFQQSNIYTKQQIQKLYPAWTKDTDTMWQFAFKVEFSDRNFTLSARTKPEMLEWVRVFQIIIAMNQANISMMDENPYTYLQRAGNTSLNDQVQRGRNSIDFGLGSVAPTELNSFTSGNWVEQPDSAVAAQARISEEQKMNPPSPFQGISEQLLHTFDGRANSKPIKTERLGGRQRHTTANLLDSTPMQQQPAPAVYNQNINMHLSSNSGITVQNITIHNMNFGSGLDANPAEVKKTASQLQFDVANKACNNTSTAEKQPRKNLRSVNSARAQKSMRTLRQRQQLNKDQQQVEQTTHNSKPLQEQQESIIPGLEAHDIHLSPQQHLGLNENSGPESSNILQVSPPKTAFSSKKMRIKRKVQTGSSEQPLAVSHNHTSQDEDGENPTGNTMQQAMVSVANKKAEDLQDYHIKSKTSSVMHSKRLSASNSVDILSHRDVITTKVEHLGDSKLNSSIKMLNRSIDQESPQLKTEGDRQKVPNEVTQIESIVNLNNSVDYTDSQSNYIQAHNLLSRHDSRYRRQFQNVENVDSDTMPMRYSNNQNQEKQAYEKNKSSIAVGRYLNQATSLNQQAEQCSFNKKSPSVTSNQSSMKISLSKVRLHGNKQALTSIDQARDALNSNSQKKIIKLRKTNNSDLFINKARNIPKVTQRELCIGDQPAPQIINRSVKNLLQPKEIASSVEMSTYGLPVKANVNMNLIKMIVSKSSQSLAMKNNISSSGKGSSRLLQNSAIILQDPKLIKRKNESLWDKRSAEPVSKKNDSKSIQIQKLSTDTIAQDYIEDIP